MTDAADTTSNPTEHDDAYLKAFDTVEEGFIRLFQQTRSLWRTAAADVHPDLQPIGFRVLSTLGSAGPVQAGALAEQLMVDKSVISRQSRILEELGLTTCTPDPTDGRARILSVSPRGVERLATMRAHKKDRLLARLADWKPDEVIAFAELLMRFTTGAPSVAEGDEARASGPSSDRPEFSDSE